MGIISKLKSIPSYVVGLSAVGTIIGVIILTKDRKGGRTFEGDQQLGNKTVVITGATSGIGKETAKQLAKRGGRIILACRDMEKCALVCQELIEETENKNLFCRHLDLASLKSIREFAEDFNKNEERLDILINNAGVLSNKRSVTTEGFEMQLGVNYLGRFLLTHLLLDKMKATDSWGRIINLVCIGYNKTRISFEDFNSEKNFINEEASKMASLANALFSMDLAEKLKGSKIGVYSANPGLCESNIRREFGPHKSSISGPLLRWIFFVSFRPPRQACQTVLFCALTPELEGVEKHSGKLFHDMCEEDIKDELMPSHTRKRLWKTAEYWTGLVDYSHLVEDKSSPKSTGSSALSAVVTDSTSVAQTN